jgi:hypothetical protein
LVLLFRTLYYLAFFWIWKYLIKVIPETHHEHLILYLMLLLYISIDRNKWLWVDAPSTCIFNICTVNSSNEYKYFLGKTVTSRCRTSQECDDKLVCIKGNCQCSEQLYWDGTNCIISKLGKFLKTITACIFSFHQEHRVIEIIYFIIQITVIYWDIQMK